MEIRDRIKDFRRVSAGKLKPNPRNWRSHPQSQRDALRGVLAEIGYADALLARELADGSLELIDGHLRAETTPDVEVPVLVLDLNDDEAAKLLALHDPLAEMAEADGKLLAELVGGIESQNEAVQAALDEMLADADSVGLCLETVELRTIPTKPPPEMTWVLVGIPTVRFGEIAESVEALALIEGTVVESTSNDGPKDR